MIDFATVKQAASGRWPEILQALGVPAESLTGKHGPCYSCGGKDTSRYAGGPDGKWFCGQAGGGTTGGDGFDLLRHVFGWSKSESLNAVADYLGIKSDTSPEAKAKLQCIRQQNERYDRERLLAHELQVFLQIVGWRVAGRELARNERFRKARPEWKPMPDETWEREEKAVRRIHALIDDLYLKHSMEVAA